MLLGFHRDWDCSGLSLALVVHQRKGGEQTVRTRQLTIMTKEVTMSIITV